MSTSLPEHDILARKLAHMQAELARTSDAAQRFGITEEIDRIEARLCDLAQPATGKGSSPTTGLQPGMQTSIGNLPGNALGFLRREAELGQLSDFLTAPDVHVAVVDAFGGIGKTALVHKWLAKLEHDGYGPVERVYAWSFYDQGADVAASGSGDAFFDKALPWFGVPDHTEIRGDERGRRLAAAVKVRPTLLILDGLEPLQEPGDAEGARLQDPAVRALLRELGLGRWQGLCLVTTRHRIKGIEGWVGVARLPLPHFAPEDGAALLKSLQVQGTDAELQAASKDLGGHALALTLLGTHLRDRNWPIKQRGEVHLLGGTSDATGHARRMVLAYQRWFARDKRWAEVSLLRVLGLFDRPIAGDVLAALRRSPAIHCLTDGWFRGACWQRWLARCVGAQDRPMDGAQFERALDALVAARLVVVREVGGARQIDAHPLVREAMGVWVREQAPPAWRAGHARVYEHLCRTAKDLPETVAEMEPLWQAIGHGCKAGRWKAVYYEVLWRRVRRDNEHFATRKLGAFAQDLAATSHFFVRPWSEPVAALHQESQSLLISAAGFDLLALGRLREAEAPMRQALELAVAAEASKNAAINACNLSELQLTLGDIAAAITQAEVTARHADASKDWRWRLVARSTHADALAQSGQDPKAQALFIEAEQLQAEQQPHLPRLYSLRGYQFCDLLLNTAAGLGWQDAAAVDHAAARATCVEVCERAELLLQWRTPKDPLLDLALEDLSHGRALAGLWRLASLETGAEPSATARLLANAGHHLDAAVEGLRKAGTLHHLPLGLLHRATFHRLTGNLAAAATDLTEALDLATSCGMRLHETDAHLGLGWLALARHDAQTAAVEADLAAQLIADTGYHRRDAELAALTSNLRSASMHDGDRI